MYKAVNGIWYTFDIVYAYNQILTNSSNDINTCKIKYRSDQFKIVLFRNKLQIKRNVVFYINYVLVSNIEFVIFHWSELLQFH